MLNKLNTLEAEVAALKAQLQKMAAEKGSGTPVVAPISSTDPSGSGTGKAPSTDGQTAATQSGGAAVPAIDESLFRPDGSGGSPATLATTQVSSAQGTPAPASALDLGQFGITYRSTGYKAADGIRFGAYGESIFGRTKENGDWKNGFDANRIVLLGTYEIAEDIIFNTELEFEHGGIAQDADDKLGGAIEVEQLFIDFRMNDHFTWRSPGVDIVPVGYVGLFHEPTQFYSAERPEIYQGLIPSTWFAPSTGAYGEILDGLNYQAQVSASLEDAGTTESNENGTVISGGYPAGISGTEALSLARAPIGDGSQLSNQIAYTLRLSYSPRVVPGLSGSTSFYYTPDTSPRGAYGTNPNGSTRPLGKSSLGMIDTEVRYRVPKTGLELRAEYVGVNFGDTDNLRANNDGDTTNNVGDSMYGYSFEAAYHVDLRPHHTQKWELVPFYRFSYINLQTSGMAGTDADTSTGAGQQRYNTFGTALFPTPKVVLKLDYQFVSDNDNLTDTEKALLGAVGFFF